MSFLNFVESNPSESGRTKTWVVETVKGDCRLGRISWYAGWRRYVFHPVDAVFDAACLLEVSAFLAARMKEREAERKDERKDERKQTT